MGGQPGFGRGRHYVGCKRQVEGTADPEGDQGGGNCGLMDESRQDAVRVHVVCPTNGVIL